MKKHKLLYFLLICLLVCNSSCRQQEPAECVDQIEAFDSQLYENDEIGWRSNIPKNWSLTQRQKLEELDSEGRNLVKDSTETELAQPNFLVGFQKDQSNNFISTSDPFNEQTDGEWERHVEELRVLVGQTYRNQGLNCELSKLEAEEISGLVFQTFSARIDVSNGSIFNQRYYYRPFDGALFGVAITFNDKELGAEMLNAWRTSKFKDTNE